MKTNRKPLLRRGMTLVEMSVAIMVLLIFIAMMFIGVRAWKRGSDRAACLISIRNVQQALRAYANMNRMEPGAPLIPAASPESTVIGPGNFLEKTPECPGSGAYSFSGATLPPIGTLFMTCTLAASDKHVPENHDAW